MQLKSFPEQWLKLIKWRDFLSKIYKLDNCWSWRRNMLLVVFWRNCTLFANTVCARHGCLFPVIIARMRFTAHNIVGIEHWKNITAWSVPSFIWCTRRHLFLKNWFCSRFSWSSNAIFLLWSFRSSVEICIRKNTLHIWGYYIKVIHFCGYKSQRCSGALLTFLLVSLKITNLITPMATIW